MFLLIALCVVITLELILSPREKTLTKRCYFLTDDWHKIHYIIPRQSLVTSSDWLLCRRLTLWTWMKTLSCPSAYCTTWRMV